MFQHHPDGLIFIRTEKGTYQDTIVNFEQDLGEAYEGLPDGYIERIYEPGIRHFLGTGDRTDPQPLDWEPGNRYISAYDDLQLRKATREALLEAPGGQMIEPQTESGT